MIVAHNSFPNPGHRVLVEFVGVDTQSERTFLGPVDDQKWAVHTPDDNIAFERFDEYVQCRDMSGRDSYFADVRAVSAYDDAIEDSELIGLIQRGRKEARQQKSISYDDSRVVCVNWSDENLIIPEPGPLTRLRHRLTGKAPLPAARVRPAAIVGAIVPADESKLAPPAGHVWVFVDPESAFE